MVTPQQPDGMLRLVDYEAVDNELLQYGSTHFAILPVINGYAEKGETVQVVTLTQDYKYCYTNPETLRTELRELETAKGITVEVESIVVPYDSGVMSVIHCFQEFIDRIDDGDELYACMTFGTKPIPIALNMALQYAYRIKKNVSVECCVYGDLDRTVDPERSRIFDITALIKLGEIVRLLAEQNVQQPEEIIRQIVEM
jgi:hypothetical protein